MPHDLHVHGAPQGHVQGPSLSVMAHVYRGMNVLHGESQGVFSGRTLRWVSNPDPHPHPISILVPCDLHVHGAPQWYGSGPTSLPAMAHVYRGIPKFHHNAIGMDDNARGGPPGDGAKPRRAGGRGIFAGIAARGGHRGGL